MATSETGDVFYAEKSQHRRMNAGYSFVTNIKLRDICLKK